MFESLAGIIHRTYAVSAFNSFHAILQNPGLISAPTDSDEAFDLLSAPHQIDHQERGLMQPVVVCEDAKRSTWALVSVFTTFRTILLQCTHYAANLLHMVVLQIGNRCVSIEEMVAGYVCPTGGTTQLNFFIRQKGGTLDNFVEATEGPNSPIEEQRFSTEDFSYIFPVSQDRTRGNPPANAAHSNAPVAEEDTQEYEYLFPASRFRTQGNAPAAHSNAPVAEEDTQDYEYIFPASRFRTQGNAPAAEEINADIGASRQQNVPSRERIEALLHISPIVKNVEQAETNKNRKKKRGKKAQQPKQPATQNEFAWDPKLIFKDGIHLLSTGFSIPIIEFRFLVQVLTICISLLLSRAG